MNKNGLILCFVFLVFSRIVNSQDSLVTLYSLGLKGKVKKYRSEKYRASEKDGNLIRENLILGSTVISHTFSSSGLVASTCRYNSKKNLIDSTVFKLDTIANMIKGLTFNRNGKLLIVEDFNLNGKLINTFHYDLEGKLVFENSKVIDKTGRIITEKRFDLDNYNGLLLVEYAYNKSGQNIQKDYSFTNDYEKTSWSEKFEYNGNGQLILEDYCIQGSMEGKKVIYKYEKNKLISEIQLYCNNDLIKETTYREIGNEREEYHTYGQTFNGYSFKKEVMGFNSQGLKKYRQLRIAEPLDSLLKIDTFIYDAKNKLIEICSKNGDGDIISQSKNLYENNKLVRISDVYGNEILKSKSIKPERQDFSYDFEGNLISKITSFTNNGILEIEEFIIEYY